jgi:hypothetical protein
MKKQIVRLGILTVVLGIFVFFTIQMMTKVDATQPAELIVQREGDEFVLSTKELRAFHRTTRQTSDARLINLPNSNRKIITWNEQENDGRKVPVYAISLDGETVSKVQETSYELMLRFAKFDPLANIPQTPDSLSAKDLNAENGTYIVQFVTQPLEDYRTAVRALGGKDYIYLANHAYLVMMNAETRQKVENLPFVRWVGRYQPAYKLEESLLEGLANDSLPKMRYNIMVLERGRSMQDKIAQKIRAMGGQVDLTIPEGFRLEATLTKEQLTAIANENEILFIDRWSAPEPDMDIVRSTGGANFIESTIGFKGEGVSAEVMDGGLLTTHSDFQSPAAITHGPAVPVDSHGTATYGIVFGTGTANPAGRGMLPNASRKIIASYTGLTNRYTHTAELKQEPYKAVFQSNSWGSTQTTAYTTISAEMDDILFKNDFVLLNSQSNTGNQSSRPQAWAKNVVSIGGIRHFNTATFDDDRWQNGASVGPAADGRIKPDLAHFYDSVFTTTSTSTTAYTTGFNGTSAATPITAGHFGIFFQMWHAGLFGNPTRATVFDSAPHMTTTKAMMINSASQWSMVAPSDATRVRQGWGRADLQNLYQLRNSFFIVDETHVLTNLQTRSYTINVSSPGRPLKATMVYADPMGNPAATRARINDLTLKVTSPTGTVYWGNNGLLDGPWSTPGGTANVVDTVENVFIQNPEVGNWTVEVIASEIVADARLETPEVDADFALVVSVAPSARKTQFDYDGDNKADISVFRPTGGLWYLQRSQTGFTALQFGIETDRIVPADYDGDGKTDVAVFRNNLWYLLRSTAGLSVENFGLPGDVPVPGDWDGDGKADLAVYRAGTGGGQSTFYYRGSANNPNGNISFIPFGTGGDVPVANDFDGDGKMDAAVFRPTDRVWYIQQSQTGFRALQFGFATDKLVPADYDGDGKTDVAVYRDGTWYLQRSTAGFTALQFGLANDVPTPADYDGDGKADTAVYRGGVWYLLNSTSGFSATQFGLASDRPTEAAYVR